MSGAEGHGSGASDGARSLTYDLENRLTSVAGSGALSLEYDPLGRLARTTAGAAVTSFVYDGDRLVEKYGEASTACAPASGASAAQNARIAAMHRRAPIVSSPHRRAAG